MKKKTYVIGCAVLAVDMKQAARELGIDLDFTFLEAGLHNNPNLLLQKLQQAIDAISTRGDGDRIIIGYGVCGYGTIGIRSRNISLVIPKVHDCIALFLGGDGAYKKQFAKYPGTFYLSAGWCEGNSESMDERKQWAWFGSEKLKYEDLVKTYGAEAANCTFDFLNSWQKNYKRAAFIETGSKQSSKYEAYARQLAQEYNWAYEKINGNRDLIKKLLTSEQSNREILCVPPQHVIGFDAVISTLSANPVWDKRQNMTLDANTGIEVSAPQHPEPESIVQTGLGIDAGGTYTDAVIYRPGDKITIDKSKALTTKWDFTIGIDNALKKLDPEQLLSVELVALSTTLATNAIVESKGQKVGMILMPTSVFADNIEYEPKAVIRGELDIKGNQQEGVDPDQVREVADRMIKNQNVTAFAVSGYASCINPIHELEVKRILKAHTGFFVSCGHELSDSLNFKTRAVTAMLNARIIPMLDRLLSDLEMVMDRYHIRAPIVVVKGDGTLMSAEMAKQRPVETVLSGPAASVAGARHLTGFADALVVDMGGTTTDTAGLTDGQVCINETGSNVGGHRTHVKALDIRTVGLGGDSLIALEGGRFKIGPARVAPIAWLSRNWPRAKEAVQFLGCQLDRYAVSTRKMQILVHTGARRDLNFNHMEHKILSLLEERPMSIDELVIRADALSDATLPLNRLEENFLIQRCGLTLTDLLHVTGRFVEWDIQLASDYCQLYASLSGKSVEEMIECLLQIGIDRLSLELLKRQLEDQVNPDEMDTCPVCKVLMDNLLSGGSDQYQVGIKLKRPVVGIGAPVHYFLTKAATVLGAKAVLPRDADVANAIGAITSNVVIKKQFRIVPSQAGGFIIEGLVGSPKYETFQDADLFAREELTRIIRQRAREAGCSATRVDLLTRDKIARTAMGEPVFMGRIIKGVLTGQPDRVLEQHHEEEAVSIAMNAFPFHKAHNQ